MVLLLGVSPGRVQDAAAVLRVDGLLLPKSRSLELYNTGFITRIKRSIYSM